MVSRWTGAFQIAAVYVGTVVGAGFATGREIAEFFTQYGMYGFFGILIAGYIFIFTGAKIMLLSSRAAVSTYEEFNQFLFGKKIAAFVNILFMLMLIGVTAVMISGAGAVFEEQLGISKNVGVTVTILFATMVLMGGMKGLFAVNSFVVPLMIFFSVILCILTINEGGFVSAFTVIPEGRKTLDIVMSPFAYSAFNLSLSLAVLVPVAYDIREEKVLKRGAMLGGFFLTVILLTGHFSLVMLPDLLDYSIPSAELMKNAAANLHWLFVLVIYGEIFTSVIGNIFGLQKQIQKYIKVPGFLVMIMICLLSALIGKFEYGQLLGYLYPLFGYITLIFLVLVWFRNPIRKKP
ncbi:YkvI family membrane protein [Peribacillus huizhouensis]|uniref:Membrane protein YkvI n=1 Tax=Peribacillus huizhouensis TaxID=1501239 RepID=A0ABR6CKC5_9BACI|nr:hypothetical protein [Peribacillus huizhouensis]MBA9025063.1 putative membrane protein YkvI [Peribacillus huizhouensis]